MRIGAFHGMRQRWWFVLVAAAAMAAACSPVERERPRIAGAGPPQIRPSQIKMLSAAPVKGEAAIFAFQPVTGAPAEMIFALEDLIAKEAKVRRINLVKPGDPTATYIVQGYISAVGDPHSALMVYVWDVFDRGGIRIHRFTGQETAPGSGSDPWSGVDREIMGHAARETIDAIAEWIRE